MAPTQSCNEERLLDYSRKLKAVGHPIRLKLLCLIARDEDPCVSDLWQCLKQPQPVVSQHLSILKDNGIVDAEVQKTRRVYSIVDPFIKKMINDMLKTIALETKTKA
ncbi:MAG: transcriptional regulator [Spirochaetes bacterium GWD1_61_31]|nr:MAG: transcriptional regulator [Spirochaetes bacterium GWB1_60_80]OHD31956.1 MAG: transcriptional regulator [Spirochaetes bacterium GWC1_61_12]OHD42119.1 MAG: transcriptional regulator [Spirochaetes bacterium GWD1_61_31]OHD43336.1 MAG: transcriptional regulator [Spirochaetes bacterium GWE1_60_18]OHD58875.1 MAG: transcriptional regulator [Spirochaetes bacterium GWF1_60_12]HAP42530.1 transcriptional regulator [Spirochaetaceae bacterium]